MLKIDKDKKTLEGLDFIDLFAGIGGFHYALKSFGANCVFASEIDKKAAKVYELNHHLKPSGDITEINEQEIPKHDILCGGFPCQAFSISGRQRGFEDTRGTLFFEIARIVDFHRPKILFLENVKNFVKHDNGRTLRTVVETLESLNYEVYYKVLNTSNFGLPQNRERVYIVAFQKSEFKTIKFTFPNPNLSSSLEDVLVSNPENAKIIERDDINIYKEYKQLANIFNEIEMPNKPIQIGKVNKGGQGERIYHPSGHAITLSAYGGGVGSKTGLYKINDTIRKLAPRECARVQGFPEDFILPNSPLEAQQQFGNSVSVNTLQFIILEVAKTIQHNDKQSKVRVSNSQKWIQEREGHSSEIQQLAN